MWANPRYIGYSKFYQFFLTTFPLLLSFNLLILYDIYKSGRGTSVVKILLGLPPWTSMGSMIWIFQSLSTQEMILHLLMSLSSSCWRMWQKMIFTFQGIFTFQVYYSLQEITTYFYVFAYCENILLLFLSITVYNTALFIYALTRFVVSPLIPSH